MWLKYSVSFFCVVVVSVASLNLEEQLEKDDIIEAVNQAKTTWKAGRNFDPSNKKSYIKHLLGVLPRTWPSSLPEFKPTSDISVLSLPKTFDARNHWKKCTVIKQVRDQGPCGSCWAVAGAAAFSDRLCIASEGSFDIPLSAEQLVSCCHFCGFGCNGGEPDLAWTYFQTVGLVTGGEYESDKGCQPYSLPACEHHITGTRENCSDYGEMKTPRCQKTCTNSNYTIKFKRDLRKVKSTFTLKKEADILLELFTKGPLEASFSVYEDFVSYKSGVYQHTTGELVGGHAVKLLGWGVEDGTPYWLVANNWNNDWGDQDSRSREATTNVVSRKMLSVESQKSTSYACYKELCC